MRGAGGLCLVLAIYASGALAQEALPACSTLDLVAYRDEHWATLEGQHPIDVLVPCRTTNGKKALARLHYFVQDGDVLVSQVLLSSPTLGERLADFGQGPYGSMTIAMAVVLTLKLLWKSVPPGTWRRLLIGQTFQVGPHQFEIIGLRDSRRR